MVSTGPRTPIPGSVPGLQDRLDGTCVVHGDPTGTVPGFVGEDWTTMALFVLPGGHVRDPLTRAGALIDGTEPGCEPCTTPDGEDAVKITVCTGCVRRVGRDFPDPVLALADARIPFVEYPGPFIVADWPLV